jgi:type IV pilus assembly protein PilV
MERTLLIPHRGFSLIEVMVALALLAIGLLGLLALQGHGLEGQQRATHQTRALQLAADLGARLRANPAGDYSLDTHASVSGGGPDCHVAPCSPEELAAFDRTQWRALVATALPRAHIRLRPDGDIWRLRLRWEARSEGPATDGDCPPASCLRREFRQ